MAYLHCQHCGSNNHTTSWHEHTSAALPTAGATFFHEGLKTADGRPGFNKDQDSMAKPRPGILPWVAIMHVLDVMEHGAKKHGTHNWRMAAGIIEDMEKIKDAIGRHYLELMRGQNTDTDSGLPVLAHLATEVLFLLELQHPQTPWTDSFKERR